YNHVAASLLLHRDGLQPRSVTGRVPHCEAHPLLPGRIERNLEGLRAEGQRIGEIDDLPVDARAVAPYKLCEIEWVGIFNGRVICALCSRTFNSPVVEENLTRGAKEIPGTDAFDDRCPTLVIEGYAIEF